MVHGDFIVKGTIIYNDYSLLMIRRIYAHMLAGGGGVVYMRDINEKLYIVMLYSVVSIINNKLASQCIIPITIYRVALLRNGGTQLTLLYGLYHHH